jgi:hypothetical protein
MPRLDSARPRIGQLSRSRGSPGDAGGHRITQKSGTRYQNAEAIEEESRGLGAEKAKSEVRCQKLEVRSAAEGIERSRDRVAERPADDAFDSCPRLTRRAIDKGCVPRYSRCKL